ncbi:F0F1 ATP synthase subunit B [Buchnera aphidicola (Mindarus keteleerifoliae)]|uniref:F0F1 ATP synthase subunit B n=1 Tax=Buchnera aphidicola TaxID=9 RepID=UPI0031B6FFF6
MDLNATILGQTISFIFFVWFCMKYIWPPIIETIEERKKEIQNGLIYSKEAKKKLLAIKENKKKKIFLAQEKANIILKKANEEYRKILEFAKKKAEKEKQKIIKEASLTIEIKQKKICEELKNNASTLAITIAEKIIRKSMNESKNNIFIKKYISNLKGE